MKNWKREQIVLVAIIGAVATTIAALIGQSETILGGFSCHRHRHLITLNGIVRDRVTGDVVVNVKMTAYIGDQSLSELTTSDGLFLFTVDPDVNADAGKIRIEADHPLYEKWFRTVILGPTNANIGEVLLDRKKVVLFGQVREYGTSRSVEGAEIMIVGGAEGTMSDGRGNFRIDLAGPRDDVRLRVSKSGYLLWERVVHVGANHAMIIQLESRQR